jgi:hypothetical protein
MKNLFTLLVFLSFFSSSAVGQNSSIDTKGNAARSQAASSPIATAPNNKPAEPTKATVSSDAGQGMNPWWKDRIDAWAKIGTLASLVIAGLLALDQFQRNRKLQRDSLEQRKVELRWKKADLARTVLGEMWKDTYTLDAMSMLDWSSRDYDVKSTRGGQANAEALTERDVWAGLRVVEMRFDAKEWYIRDCFDHLFAIMEVVEYYIGIGLIEPSDVTYPFARLADLMAGSRKGERDLYHHFISAYDPKADEFLNRFPGWKDYEPGDANKAFFMFDCPPGKERFIFTLDDPRKIAKAREMILDNQEGLHVRGEIVIEPAYYNEPWDFHLNPATIDFVKNSSQFADQINLLVEKQLSREKETFAPNDIWNYGGARLLTEIPADEFEGETADSWLQQRDELKRQDRIRPT